MPGRGRYRGAGARFGQRRGARLRRGIGPAVRDGAGAQPLHRAHLYRAAPVDPPFRGQDQIQSGRSTAARQAGRAGRGFAGARHHAAQGYPDAAAGGRARSPYADRGAADDQFMLLRHRHADPRGTAGLASFGRGDPPLYHRRFARLSELGRPLFVPRREREGYCDACFTGKYPVEIPKGQSASAPSVRC